MNILSVMLFIPALMLSYLMPQSTNGLKWLFLFIAFLGATLTPISILVSHWGGGVAFSLRITVLVILALYGIVSLRHAFFHRLSILIFPYLIMVSIGAIGLDALDDRSYVFYSSSNWIFVHIISGILTYASITLAAVVSFSVYLSQKNLKNKQSNKITTLLPSINECNYIQTKLLIFAEVILICGFFSGLSLQYFSTGAILIIDHKAIFTILAMVVIAIILFLQERSGVRGKIAVRFIMLAYLLLTLAYPGVKFVAQIVI
jgi:ABC-type uncharacterized transport system permease subunit